MVIQTPATSSIAMALAGKTASVDIPKPRVGLDPSFSRHHHHHPVHQPDMLPTPPNSISPNLPPHNTFKQRSVNFPASPCSASVDSDIDLVRDTATTHHQGPDNVGDITPVMLAEHHLPDILLLHGPLAIRNIMACLATSVPGFARIPPTKARRLVVAALECRGTEAEVEGDGEGQGNGRSDDVIFEKIGWGRWDARRRGEPMKRHRYQATANSSSPPTTTTTITTPSWSKRDSIGTYGTSSVTGDSTLFSHLEMDDSRTTEDIDMLEHEADKMSLDDDNGEGRDYCSSSEAPDDIQEDEWDEGDVTDEEDWAQIGAEGLRAQSLNAGAGFMHGGFPRHVHVMREPQLLPRGGPDPPSLAKSAPCNVPIQHKRPPLPDGLVGGEEECAAVEALLRLGSV